MWKSVPQKASTCICSLCFYKDCGTLNIFLSFNNIQVSLNIFFHQKTSTNICSPCFYKDCSSSCIVEISPTKGKYLYLLTRFLQGLWNSRFLCFNKRQASPNIFWNSNDISFHQKTSTSICSPCFYKDCASWYIVELSPTKGK